MLNRYVSSSFSLNLSVCFSNKDKGAANFAGTVTLFSVLIFKQNFENSWSTDCRDIMWLQQTYYEVVGCSAGNETEMSRSRAFS